MNRFLSVILVSTTALFQLGCSSGESLRQAELGFDYLDVAGSEPMIVPQGIETPAYSNEFVIPEVGDKAPAQYVGGKVDVRAPALVLPITRGSRVEEGKDAVILWIDLPQGKAKVEPHVWQILTDYLESQHTPVKRISKEKGEIETGWALQSSEDDDVIFNIRQRYLYHIQFKPHGRTMGLSALLLEHEQQVEGAGWHAGVDSVDKHRYSVQALNKLILYYDARRQEYEKILATKKEDSATEELTALSRSLEAKEETQHELAVPNITVLTAFDQEPPRIILDKEYAKIGPALQHALQTMGFDIKDVIAIDGYVKLDLVKPDPLSLAEYNIEPLALKSGGYQMMIGDLAGQTSLLFSDRDGKVLPQWQVQSIFDHLVPLMKDGVYPKKG